MRNDLGFRMHLHHCLCCNLSLKLANVALPEEKLSIQITQLDSIKIDLAS